MNETPHERLDRLMNDRRLELPKINGKTVKWFQIAEQAGITVTTLGALRKGENEPTEDTKHGVEAALQWSAGSIDRILAGGEPGKHASGTGRIDVGVEATGSGSARQSDDEEDPFERMDRLYEEWKRDPEDRPLLEGLLDGYEKRKTG